MHVEGVVETIRAMSHIATQQIPFALAATLTSVAKDAQADCLRELPHAMILRTKWYQPSSPLGLRVDPARKDRLAASVYTRAPWMDFQVFGGTRHPRQKKLAVPSDNVRRNRREVIRPNQRPSRLTRTFFIGATLWRRFSTHVIKLMYAMTPRAMIRPRFPMHVIVADVVNQRFEETFWTIFADALRTAR